MGQWRGAWMMGVCLALAGCNSHPSNPSPETPPNDERSGSPQDPNASTPPTGSDGNTSSNGDTPPAATATPSPLEKADPSLTARACIPWTSSTAPVRATACASKTVLADGTSQSARYDADSHPLEVRTFTASGALSNVVTQVWHNGLQQSQRTDLPNGPEDLTEWTYDSKSRLTRVAHTFFLNNPPDVNSSDYTYDAQGRISQIIIHVDNEASSVQYKYNAAGQLVSITGDCGSGDTRCSALTYWPNGHVKEEDWQVSDGRESFKDNYNELGQLISSTMQYDQASGNSTRAYDSAGHLIRLRESGHSTDDVSDTYTETLTTTVYDPAGQRERFAQDQRKECVDNDCGPNHDQAKWTDYKRVTHRTTFFCNTQIVALDEWDSNEDGVADAQRTHERDSAGRLIHEAYSGTPGLDDGPVSRDFQYDCH